MINIISRSLVAIPGVSGPKKVVENLIKGLDLIGYPYVVNQRLDATKRLYIHDDRVALNRISILNPAIKVIFGPNLFVRPADVPKSLNVSRAVCLAPSKVTMDFWRDFGFSKCPLDYWATGIDTFRYKPQLKEKDIVMIYFKQRLPYELSRVRSVLDARRIRYELIVYGSYKESAYQELLARSRYIVWLGRHETQGIALQEALAANIPILVCDVWSIGHSISGGGEFTSDEAAYPNASAAPYFDDRCGKKIWDFSDFPSAIDYMEREWRSFKPRSFVVENLSLEKQAKDLVLLYEKHFGLRYEDGLREKTIHPGVWRNARPWYAWYLRKKHSLVMIFDRLGIWWWIKNHFLKP